MITTPAHINDLISDAMGTGEGVKRDKADFSPDFWNLRTGLLGELAQKLANYRITLTLTGDLAPEIATSRALRDYGRELTRAGGPIRFASPPDLHAEDDSAPPKEED